ncbi:hypothetical protein ACHAWF_001675, partial [Thalassiosira exigua]
YGRQVHVTGRGGPGVERSRASTLRPPNDFRGPPSFRLRPISRGRLGVRELRGRKSLRGPMRGQAKNARIELPASAHRVTLRDRSDRRRLGSVGPPADYWPGDYRTWARTHDAPSSSSNLVFFQVQAPSLLRHHHRRQARRPDRHGAPRRRRPQDRRELPRPLHRREGVRIRRIVLPPRHPRIHVPRGGLHQPQR